MVHWKPGVVILKTSQILEALDSIQCSARLSNLLMSGNTLYGQLCARASTGSDKASAAKSAPRMCRPRDIAILFSD
jgi:hypothetical protein